MNERTVEGLTLAVARLSLQVAQVEQMYWDAKAEADEAKQALETARKELEALREDEKDISLHVAEHNEPPEKLSHLERVRAERARNSLSQGLLNREGEIHCKDHDHFEKGCLACLDAEDKWRELMKVPGSEVARHEDDRG